MAEQTINADFNRLTGATAPDVAVRILRMEIFGVSGEVVLGGTHTVTADGNGLASFTLEPGGYLIEYESNAGLVRTGFSVGESGPYDLGDLLENQAIPVTPSILQQCQALRNETEGFKNETEQFRDETEEFKDAAEEFFAGNLWYIIDDTTSVTVGVGVNVVVQDPGPGPYDTITLELA